MNQQQITIVGATSGPGKSLFLKLAALGRPVLGIGRSQTKVAELRALTKDTRAEIIAVDVALDQDFLSSTDILIHCSQPNLVKHLLSSNLDRFIGLGSTRKFTRFPDQKCIDVTEMERIVMSSGVDATVLHPTLIYGADGLNNVERIANTARRSPIIPLPAKGLSLIQPIHCDDVVDSIISCIDNRQINKTIVIAGPSPITYRHFVQTVIDAAGLSSRIVSLPNFAIASIAQLTTLIPAVPTISTSEVKRLLEDKHFDTVEMNRDLGIKPRSFETGMGQYSDDLKQKVYST